jgi:hypothetical protein
LKSYTMSMSHLFGALT